MALLLFVTDCTSHHLDAAFLLAYEVHPYPFPTFRFAHVDAAAWPLTGFYQAATHIRTPENVALCSSGPTSVVGIHPLTHHKVYPCSCLHDACYQESRGICALWAMPIPNTHITLTINVFTPYHSF